MSEINKIIKLSAPPLLWSSVERAFNDINYNFDTLFASLGSGSLIDFTNLGGSLKPRLNATYDLGSVTQKWRQLYVSEDNGITIGNAQITATGSAINLPSGSTIGGAVLDNEYFREISVTGQPSLIADAGGDAVLTVNPGTGISITTNATTDTINFTNTGIISASAGTGISVSGTNPLQITNSGIISASAGAGISVSGTNPLQITNTGVTRIEAGNGMIVDVNTGTVTITNGSPASTLRCFEYINLGTGGIVRADNNFDTVNITGDEHILINKVGSAATNNIEFTFNNRVDIIGSVFGEDSSVLVDATDGKHYGYFQGDITGSVFADDSTKLVDAVEAKIVGDIDTASLRTSETKIALGLNAGAAGANAIAIGEMAGQTTQGNRALAVGFQAGFINQGARAIAIGQGTANGNQGANGIAIGETAAAGNQGTDAIAIGQNAAQINQGNDAIAIGRSSSGDNQGIRAIAIGNFAAASNQTSGSIVINATGSAITASAAGFYVDPIRNLSGTSLLVYNSTTKEITHSNEINSETSIKININLTDSTIQTWEFTEGGDLIFPNGSSISSEEGGAPTLVIDGGGNYVDIRDSGTILIGYNSTGNVQIGNPDGGTLTEILSERVKFLSQTVPASSIGVTGDDPGLIAFDATYMYYCTGTYDGVANIWKRVAWSGDTW